MNPTVLVVMGVSGSGKSTLGRLLAQRLGWDFQEGDDLHPAANIAKMPAGIPLTDADRWPWLDRVAAWIRERLEAGQSGVVACSALKRSYRDVLRGKGVRFVYLHGERDAIAARLAARRGHYMPAALLDSQFAALEPPQPDEGAITVNIAASPETEADAVLADLRS
ncbi:gluconokinase [Skermania sp. ID1734]|uniref:gluconokinase n=1 Tax=Skermania sp. ID1734 TaxID=2597516 RepID=UPI0011806FB9|nr:gluconokinase [Skermania sp. ID1734]TSD95644.1 gluconokinase [Skermania sp. ID1734]